MRRSDVSAHTHADLRNYTIRYTLCVGCFIKRRFLNHKSCIYIFLDPVCAMQAYRGRRGIAPLILKLSAKWSTFKFTFLPFRPGRTNPVPFNRRLPGLQIQPRHFVEYTFIAPAWIRTLKVHSPRIYTYYRLQSVSHVLGCCLAIGGILCMCR